MADAADAPPEDATPLTFVEKFESADRGLQFFLLLICLGIGALIWTVLKMVRAAFGSDGWDFSEEAATGEHAKALAALNAPKPTPKPMPKATPRPPAHVAAAIKPAKRGGKAAAVTSCSKDEAPRRPGAKVVPSSGGGSGSGSSGKRREPASSKLKVAAGSYGPRGSRKAFSPLDRESDDDDDDDDEVEAEDDEMWAEEEEEEEEEEGEEEEEEQPSGLTRLTLQTRGGEEAETELDLSEIESMAELQRLVQREWAELIGGKLSSGMMMEFMDEEGDFVKVVRSTPIEEVTTSSAIRMLPKSSASGR